MGQSYSSTSSPSPSRRFKKSRSTAVMLPVAASDSYYMDRDHTVDIPDEILALIFQSLNSGDRKQCSLVCKRWFHVDGQSRHRLSLDARAALFDVIRSVFERFDSVTKLALKCDRRSDSIGDEALSLISKSCPNLTRLKLRACREITDVGMAAVAENCKNLKKFSCGSCTFGAKGIDAIVKNTSLEEISIKRLRGLTDIGTVEVVNAGAASTSLKSVCLKELYNGQCFGPMIYGAENLRTLKIFRCSGDWDRLLEDVSEKCKGIVEIHLEKLHVSDRGLISLSSCSKLEVLHLVKTPECTDMGLSSIAERCKLLRKLHIDGWKTNRIGDEGLISIGKRCPNLQELVLMGVNPTVLSVSVIAGNCKSLERLALCTSETIGDAEFTCIATKCLALKKLCIKSCPISDIGIEALAEGCPNLVKVKIKKCRGVTVECAEWLRSIRETLSVSLDSIAQMDKMDTTLSEMGMIENAIGEQISGIGEQIESIDIASSSNGRALPWKNRRGFTSGRNFLVSTFRRWSGGNGGCSSSGGSNQQSTERE